MTVFTSYRQQLRESALAHRQDGFHLHPYQEEAVQATWTTWQAGHLDALVSLPTGTGKTEVALELMCRVLEQEPTGRILFLAHRRGLVMQVVDRLRMRQPQWANEVGAVMGGICDARLQERADRRIVVATVQSLIGHGNHRMALLRRVQRCGPFAMLTIDEAHHATARAYRDVTHVMRGGNPSLRHLGMTATPVRHDEDDLSQVYTLAYYRSIRWAVENGYLVPPEGIRVSTDVNLAGVRCRGGDFLDDALGQALNTPAFNAMLVRVYKEFLFGVRTLVFCATVNHAKAVQEEFEKCGIQAGLVVGTTDDQERQNIIATFVRGETRVIVNVGVFTEGTDIPCAEGLVMARPTQSAVLYTQIVGRVMRLSPGKPKATIVDITGTGQTLFTLDDMMETPSYRRAVKAGVDSATDHSPEIIEDASAANAQGPLRYWSEVVSLLGRSPIAWYSARGRSVATLARQQYALLMPPGGPSLATTIQDRLEQQRRSKAIDAVARLEWQRGRANDFCLFWVHNGKCEPVDWDRDYNTLLSVASAWMEDKVERTLSARERRWRFAPATDRQVASMARWGIIPNVEWLRAREREVGLRLSGGMASDLLSYKIALSVYVSSGFSLGVPPAPGEAEESAEPRFRRLLREQSHPRQGVEHQTSTAWRSNG